MEIDLSLAGNEVDGSLAALRADVCVIGGGIAGLLLADRLSEAGTDVLLLEAGGPTPDDAGQKRTTEVQLTGEPHLGTRDGRTRALGGSSVTWGGQLLPMGDSEGWPVPSAELGPYFPEVEELLGVDDLAYDARNFLTARSAPCAELLDGLPGLAARMSKFAPFARRNLGASLGRRLLRHAQARVITHAQVTALELDQVGERVAAVVVRTPSGKTLRVEAQQVVIAAGTVETCRLLLLSSARCAAGVGNAHDQVGRNFHDHLTLQVASFRGSARQRTATAFRPWLVGGLRGTAHALKLEADDALRRRLGLNHALAHFVFEEPEGSGVAALRQLLVVRQKEGNAAGVGGWSALPGAGLDLLRLERDARLSGRRYLSPEAQVSLRVNIAQASPSGSRVLLSKGTDGTGLPRARVDWYHAPADRHTLRAFAAYLREQLVDSGFAAADEVVWNTDVFQQGETVPERDAENASEEPILGIEDARHAMGGACMGSDPRNSVVDAELRVHGISNLFIASAAVFPDGRAQLPTMTLMALALRLGDRLVRGPAR